MFEVKEKAEIKIENSNDSEKINFYDPLLDKYMWNHIQKFESDRLNCNCIQKSTCRLMNIGNTPKLTPKIGDQLRFFCFVFVFVGFNVSINTLRFFRYADGSQQV